MGSFNMSCGVTGYPFNYNADKGIVIPVIVDISPYEKPVYMHEKITLFPFFVTGTYDDYGRFEIDETDISSTLLSNVYDVLNNAKANRTIVLQDIDEEENLGSKKDFSWEKFFDLCHENYEVDERGRISYVAIHQNVYESILNEYTLYGPLDLTVEKYDSDNFGDYNFEHYLNQRIQKELAVQHKKDAQKQKFLDIINSPQSTDNEKEKAKIRIEALDFSFDFSSREKPFDLYELEDHNYNSEELRNNTFLKFLNNFMGSINKPWQESVYAGQETDNSAFKILRNSLVQLTQKDTISFLEENNVESDYEVIDSHDKKLISILDELKTVEVSYIKK